MYIMTSLHAGCVNIPKRSMIVCNTDARIRARREMNVLNKIVKQASSGVYIQNGNSGLSDGNGMPILLAIQETNALVNDNDNDGGHIKDNIVNTNPPEVVDATDLGALVARNAFAHIAGPFIQDENGVINYSLDLRGYNKGGLQSGRDEDDYMGLQLYHDGTDGILVLSSGSDTTISNVGLPNQDISVNYEAGETMRLRVSGPDTALGDRTVTFERRSTDSVDGGGTATWLPVMRLSA